MTGGAQNGGRIPATPWGPEVPLLMMAHPSSTTTTMSPQDPYENQQQLLSSAKKAWEEAVAKWMVAVRFWERTLLTKMIRQVSMIIMVDDNGDTDRTYMATLPTHHSHYVKTSLSSTNVP